MEMLPISLFKWRKGISSELFTRLLFLVYLLLKIEFTRRLARMKLLPSLSLSACEVLFFLLAFIRVFFFRWGFFLVGGGLGVTEKEKEKIELKAAYR